MTTRRRQTNAGLSVLLIALLVTMSVGAVVLVGVGPVAAQSNETGDNGTNDGPVTDPIATGDAENETAGATNETNESTNDSAPTGPTVPSGSPGAQAGPNESGNESGNSSGGYGGSETYKPEGNDDNGLFSISIDPVGLLINFFEPFFTFGTDMLVEMATVMQDSMVYPMQDGSVSISGEPEGDLMSVLWQYWYEVSLLAAAAIWLMMVIVLYILGMVWPPTPTYQQIKIAQQEAWIKLLLIPFSWALGAIILFLASYVLNVVPLNPETIAPDLSSVAANNAAAGISLLLLYAFGGPFALAIAVTFFGTWLFVYITFPLLPILIALSVPKVWIMKGLAESFEGIVQKFPQAAFFSVPAVLVLSVGYTILGMIENLLPGPAEWGAVPASAVAIVIIWIIAFFASMYMFWSKSLGSGTGAILAGTVGIGAVSSALGRLGGGSAAAAGGAAGGAAGSGASTAAGGVSNAVNGHALGSGGSSTSGALGSGPSSSGLSAGGSDLASAGASASTPASAGASTGTNPSGTALPGGSGSPSSPGASVSSSGVASSATSSGDSGGTLPGRVPVDDPTVTTIDSADDLSKDQEYRAGYFTGSGPGADLEYQKVLDVPRSQETVTSDRFKRIDEAYGERDLLVRGEADNQFYDVSKVVGSGDGLSLSPEEQNAESRSTVDSARGS